MQDLCGGSEENEAKQLDRILDNICCKHLSLAERLINRVLIGGSACWTRDAVLGRDWRWQGI
jgi:hypothetical protein